MAQFEGGQTLGLRRDKRPYQSLYLLNLVLDPEGLDLDLIVMPGASIIGYAFGVAIEGRMKG